MGNGGTITRDVTFVGANMAAPVRVHNVANGTLANDAVNVGQLQAAMAASQTYTDSRIANLTTLTDARFAQVNFDLGELRNDAFAGVAGAMAFAGLPQTMDPSKSMVAGAVSHYRGETAFAMGVSSAFNDGAGIVKFGGSIDTRGHAGVTAGAGFSF